MLFGFSERTLASFEAARVRKSFEQTDFRVTAQFPSKGHPQWNLYGLRFVRVQGHS